MNCNHGSSSYRDRNNEEESEEREEEFYRNILGLKESYSDSLDIKYEEKYEDKENENLEYKIKKSKKDLRIKIKRELADLAVATGLVSAGLLLSYESLLKFNNYNKEISLAPRLTFPMGLGLIVYGFYRSVKRLLRK